MTSTGLFSYFRNQLIFISHFYFQVINVPDCPTIYHVPLMLLQQGLVQQLTDKLGLSMRVPKKKFMQKWKELANRAEHLRKVNAHFQLHISL
jgi:CTP synthase (UTP-ammonia lyase)